MNIVDNSTPPPTHSTVPVSKLQLRKRKEQTVKYVRFKDENLLFITLFTNLIFFYTFKRPYFYTNIVLIQINLVNLKLHHE